MSLSFVLFVAAVASFPFLAAGVCPGLFDGTPLNTSVPIPDLVAYNAALKNLDIAAVIADIETLLTDSQSCWPADDFAAQGLGASYGPFFIRLTWHCAGSFRATDGAGGCGGGRMRFSPEASWADNTNLDKARALLAPIKDTYGIGLSWGDLMVFAGTAAILNMGGPVTEICAGRIDDSNGTASDVLDTPTCVSDGDCEAPRGSDTAGLIYVNPGGVNGVPDPGPSAARIREVFSRMDMNDRETLALIGGGHAFGKCHGACPAGAGLPPDQAPTDPWPGLCGTGDGADTFTSGFEGVWTHNPLQWDNEFFQLISTRNYELSTSPANASQWHLMNATASDADLMMLTTDLALIYDANYSAIVDEYASNQTALDVAFSGAWAKLVTSGGQWAAEMKCIDPAATPQPTIQPATMQPTTQPTAPMMSGASRLRLLIALVLVIVFVIFNLD